MTLEKYLLFPLLLTVGACSKQADPPSAREMYDSMSKMVTGSAFPSHWWEERNACLASLSPTLETTMDKAWAGMRHFWTTRGQEGDTWRECPQRGEETSPRSGWFESNCTRQALVEMDIWEPCNYISNLAYDRLMVEMCLQENWTLSQATVSKIAQAFAINTFASAFMHGSDTNLGGGQDVRSNDLFPFIIYQAGVSNIAYDPIIHDLSTRPRNVTGEGAVDIFHNMYNNEPVENWHDLTSGIDLPRIQRTFGAIFGYILTLLLDPATVDQLAPPLLDLLGVSEEDHHFLQIDFLPAIRNASSHHYLGLRDRLELGRNTFATALKLLYAFVWQEDVIDFGGANLTPEANAAGAAALPYINEFANMETSWSLHLQDVQVGEGYPGWQVCNPIIPHAKWHVQTAAALGDVARLMDWVVARMT